MSDADYVRMRTPKKGLKSVEGDIRHEDPALWDTRSWSGLDTRSQLMGNGFFQTLFWAPFNSESAPGLWSVIGVGLLVYVACLVNGWVITAAYAHALAVAGDAFIRAILIAAVSASMFYVTQMWTHESMLPTFVYPEHSLAMIATLRIGVVTALGYGVVQFGGYASAGGIVRALNGVTPGVTNVAVSANSYWLYWFGTSVVVFSYLYNAMLRQGPVESTTKAHYRASAAAAMAIFAVIVAFYTLGLVHFSSGLYVTGVIVTGANSATFVGDPVTPWAAWVFIALLAASATGALLYVLFGLLHSEVLPRFTMTVEREGSAYVRTPAGVSKRVATKLDVNY